MIFDVAIIQNSYKNLSSVIFHECPNAIMARLIQILDAANILLVATIIYSVQIGTGQFYRSNAIASIGCRFQLSELKTFHAKLRCKACFIKSVFHGLLEPIPSFFDIFKFPFRVEFDQLEKRKLKPFVCRLLEQL